MSNRSAKPFTAIPGSFTATWRRASALSGVVTMIGTTQSGRFAAYHDFATSGDGFARGHFSRSDEWALNHPPTSVSWPHHAALSLAGACAEEVILGYRGHGAETDVATSTNLILAQFNAADRAFGPGRLAIERVRASSAPWPARRRCVTPHGSGPEPGSTSVGAAPRRLVEEHRVSIERLAAVLLEGKQTLTGDGIVAAIGETGTA